MTPVNDKYIVTQYETAFLCTNPVFIHKKWVNPLLRWNVSDFQGIEKLHVEPRRVWVPDIHLYNK